MGSWIPVGNYFENPVNLFVKEGWKLIRHVRIDGEHGSKFVYTNLQQNVFSYAEWW